MATETSARPITVFCETFPKLPALVRHPVRCGSPSCRCARRADLEAVRAIVRRRADEARCARLERTAAAADLRALVRLCRELLSEGRL